MIRAGAVVVATATMLGCGVFGQVQQAADNISAVAELSEKLGGSDKLTFTAEYRLADGSTTTVVQQPPNAAFIGGKGRFVETPQTLLICGAENSCQSSANRTGELDITNAGMIPAAAGSGFISAPIALTLLSAGSITPGATVDRTERKIAGQPSTCLKVSGIKKDGQSAAKSFSACVTDDGLLSSFAGDVTGDQTANIELTSYRGDADPQAFVAPAGHQVSNVDQLQVPAG